MVSVILPAYNSNTTLRRSIASVIAQSYQDWELIVVDDHSTDTSAEIAKTYARQDKRIQVLQHNKNQGAAVSRNTAIAAARGRYLAFLDADDAWMPDKLNTQLTFMQNRNAALCFTGFIRVGQDDAWRRTVTVPDTTTYADLLKGNVIACQTVICDRSQFDRIAMPDLRRRQDYALWLDLLKQTPVAHGLNTPLTLKYEQPKSLSSARWRAQLATWHVYRREGLSRQQATWNLSRHVLQRIRRG